MKKSFLSLALVFFVSASTASAMPAPLVLTANGWAPTITVACVDPSCVQITATHQWMGQSKVVGPVRLDVIVRYLRMQKYEKQFMMGGMKDLRYEDDADITINIFLPVIWAVALPLAVVHDLKELATNPNTMMEKSVTKLVAALKSEGGSRNLVLPYDVFGNLNAQFEKVR